MTLLGFLVVLVAGQGHNYARESDENIDWMARGASIARNWNEAILYAIRRDNTRPPIHARNLFHLSVVMYDSWAAYETGTICLTKFSHLDLSESYTGLACTT